MLKDLLRSVGFGTVSRGEDISGILEADHDTPLIRLDGIDKVFGTGETETHALSDVSLEIARGEFVTVSGPSGCGKSTLLSLIGLLETPTAGSYHLNGRAVNRFKASQLAWIRNRSVGFIFQNFNLIGDLTVFENVETPLTYLGMPSAERRERTELALERVGMESYAGRYPSQITGGQQQRVAVARAVVADPLILLADEPTGNLDSINGEAVMSLLAELHQKGSTLCLVSHNPDYASRAQRAIHLFDGTIVESLVEE